MSTKIRAGAAFLLVCMAVGGLAVTGCVLGPPTDTGDPNTGDPNSGDPNSVP